MKRIFKKKIISLLSLFILFILLICLTSIGYALSSNNIKDFGENIKSILNSKDKDEVVLVVNGTNIYKKQFDILKATYISSNPNITDKDVFDKLIERQLLFDEAVKNGVSISDEKVAEIIEYTKKAVHSNPTEYDRLKNYLKGLGVSEDEYWQQSTPTYKKMLIMGEYKNNHLKKAFEESNNITNKSELEQKFKQYYEQYINDLKSKSTIKYTKY